MEIPRWLLRPFGHKISRLSEDQHDEFKEIRHDEEMLELSNDHISNKPTKQTVPTSKRTYNT